MGGSNSVTEDTRITKDEAMTAIFEAFRGKPPSATMTIKELSLALPLANEAFPTLAPAPAPAQKAQVQEPQPGYETIPTPVQKVFEPQPSNETFPTPVQKVQELQPSNGGYPMQTSYGDGPTEDEKKARAAAEATPPVAPQPAATPPHDPEPSEKNYDVTTLEGALESKRSIAKMGKLRNMFNTMKFTDGVKLIDKEDFVATLAIDGVDQKEAQTLFDTILESDSGKLTIPKFNKYVTVSALELIREVYNVLDASEDLKIGKDEFKAYFLAFGLSDDQTEILWSKIDKNDNGKISFEGFRQWMSSTLLGVTLPRITVRWGLVQA